MRIAIVDDINKERTCLFNLLQQYFKDCYDRYSVSPEFSEYDCGESFLNTYEPGSYDLVLLDIYMQEITGIDVAKRIVALDKSCNIIFFTTSSEHQLEGYGVHAIGYIMKPVTNHLASLYNALDYFMEKYKPDISSIKVQSVCGELYLYYRDILYYECLERKLYIHMTTGVLPILGKYSDYYSHFLSDKRFLECYRNLIINMDYIETPLQNEFVLKSGDILPISRRKKAQVIESYTKYFIYKGR